MAIPNCCLGCNNQDCFGDSEEFPPFRKYEYCLIYDRRGRAKCEMRRVEEFIPEDWDFEED